MQNQLSNKSSFQELLFGRIRSELNSNQSLVDTVSDLLNISIDAAYRRIRSEKKLDMDELFTLCNHFHISVDSIFRMETDQLAFQYSQLDLNNLDCYLQYMKNFSDRLSRLAVVKDKEIRISALDIPIFHFMPFKELTLFKIFCWTNSVNEYRGTFNSFMEKIENQELFDLYGKIWSDYNHIPSVEIWTEQTIDTILRLIDYYAETGHFSDKQTALLLCNQLLKLIDNLQLNVERGRKNENSDHSAFTFYLSEIDLENNFAIFKSAETITSLIKLFTINSIATSHHGFGQEILLWLDNAIRKAVLLTGASEKVRIKFFQGMRNKTNILLDKLKLL